MQNSLFGIGASVALLLASTAFAQTPRHFGHSINLPPGTSIGGLVRGGDVVIAHDDIIVKPNDHLILFLVDKSRIKDVERLFQAPLSFI